MVDDGLTRGVARAEHHLEDAVGKPGLREQLHRGQRRERALRVGTQHDRVAGEQCRDGVGDREAERVVPRRDDADDALWPAVLHGLRQQRESARMPGVGEHGRPASGVVTGHDRAVGDLLEGVAAGLARLELDEVEQLGLVVEHEVVQAQQDLGALTQGGRDPAALGSPGQGDRLHDVARARHGQRRQRCSRERGRRAHVWLVARGDDPGGEGSRPRRIHGIRGGGVELRISDDIGHYRRVANAAPSGVGLPDRCRTTAIGTALAHPLSIPVICSISAC